MYYFNFTVDKIHCRLISSVSQIIQIRTDGEEDGRNQGFVQGGGYEQECEPQPNGHVEQANVQTHGPQSLTVYGSVLFSCGLET